MQSQHCDDIVLQYMYIYIYNIYIYICIYILYIYNIKYIYIYLYIYNIILPDRWELIKNKKRRKERPAVFDLNRAIPCCDCFRLEDQRILF